MFCASIIFLLRKLSSYMRRNIESEMKRMKRFVCPTKCSKNCYAECQQIAAIHITIDFQGEKEHSLWDRTLTYTITMVSNMIICFTERDLGEPFGHIINTQKRHNGKMIECFLFRDMNSAAWNIRKEGLDFEVVALLSDNEIIACKVTNACPRIRILWHIPKGAK